MTQPIKPFAYRIRLFHFPSSKINEAVVYNGCEDFFTILVSDTLSESGIKDAVHHAFRHIENGDFFSEQSVQEIEYEAHRG